MTRITPLLKFAFDYKRFQCLIPIVPVRFIRSDNKSTLIITAILDSGADAITIPKNLASWLQVKTELKDTSVMTATGTTKVMKGIVSKFVLGQGGREVIYKDAEVCVMENCPYILVGISPVFEDYKVTILASQKRFILEPRG